MEWDIKVRMDNCPHVRGIPEEEIDMCKHPENPEFECDPKTCPIKIIKTEENK